MVDSHWIECCKPTMINYPQYHHKWVEFHPSPNARFMALGLPDEMFFKTKNRGCNHFP